MPEGNADGAEGIFGHAGRVWAPALPPDPPKKKKKKKKDLCLTCPFGGACNKYCSELFPAPPESVLDFGSDRGSEMEQWQTCNLYMVLDLAV